MFYFLFSLLHKLIDRCIEWFIHKPIRIREEDFAVMNTERSRLVNIYTKNKEKISLVEIYPTKETMVNCNASQKYLIYSHGNNGTILSKFSYFLNLSANLNISIIAYDYIGYGLSENKLPTETGCYDSLKCTIDYVVDLGADFSNIYLMGRSLGTGVVIDYVSKNDWGTPIILISPYKSIATIILDTEFNIFYPIDKFRSVEKLKSVKCPAKIFHGEDDTVINISHGKNLYDNLPNKLFEPTWLKNIGHQRILKMITIDHYQEIISNKN